MQLKERGEVCRDFFYGFMEGKEEYMRLVVAKLKKLRNRKVCKLERLKRQKDENSLTKCISLILCSALSPINFATILNVSLSAIF